jgi:(E)-4-hydroxy-3-methyl-but-2-enyl pyrophosphate reductase
LQIVVAQKAGFCFGVRNAVDSLRKCLDQPGRLYTLGPIIHNPQVVDDLTAKGVVIAEDVDGIDGGTVVIRSHGIPSGIYEALRDKGVTIVDATCPLVRQIHDIVKKHHDEGYEIVIVGEREHPEVIGTNGWCGDTAYVVGSVAEAKALPALKKVCVVAQTTFSHAGWNEIVDAVKDRMGDVHIFNTICATTTERQQEAEKIARIADVMLVVGGMNSANTRKLVEVCSSHCAQTHHIETADDIDVSYFSKAQTVGVTAGASTPEWIIEEVIKTMSDADKKMDEEVKEMAVEESKETGTAEEPEKNPEPVDEAAEEKAEAEAPAETEAPAGVETPAEAEKSAEAEAPAKAETAVPEEKPPAKTESPAKESAGKSKKAEPAAEEPATGEHEMSMADVEESMVTLRKGKIATGKIIKITDNEVIINLGYKADGILPIEEVFADPAKDVNEAFKPGDEIEVQVVRMDDGDGNVQVTRKSIETRTMWRKLEDGFNAQTEYKTVCEESVKGGVIAQIEGFRAFVPASQLIPGFVRDLSTFVDKELRLRIIEVDRRRRRVVASQRIILEEEQGEAKERVFSTIEEGQRIKGTVQRLAKFGAFVDIGGVDGLVHISDLSWGHIRHPREAVQPGQEIEVIVLGVDKERERISLGYKQTRPHPWENIEEKYIIGTIVKGKVARIASFGAFIELEPGVDGLVHISEVADHHVEKVEDVLKVGDEISVKVLDVDPEGKRISLSIRATLPPKEKPAPAPRKKAPKQKAPAYEKEEMTVSLGEFFSDKLKDSFKDNEEEQEEAKAEEPVKKTKTKTKKEPVEEPEAAEEKPKKKPAKKTTKKPKKAEAEKTEATEESAEEPAEKTEEAAETEEAEAAEATEEKEKSEE